MQLAAATEAYESPLFFPLVFYPQCMTKTQRSVLVGLLRTRALPTDSRAFIAHRLVDPGLTKREASILVRALHRADRQVLRTDASEDLVDDVSLASAALECKADKRHAKNNFIPRDYDELFAHYFQCCGKFRGSVAYKFAQTKLPTCSEEDYEDICVRAFEWCWHKDIIAWFDPTMANFGALVYWAIRNATCIYMAKQVKNPLGVLRAGSLSNYDVNDNSYKTGVFFADRLLLSESIDNQLYGSPQVCDDLEQVTATRVVLDRIAVRIRERGTAQMLTVFALQREGLTQQQIAKRLGVSAFPVSQCVKAIRALALATEDEVFERKPRESKTDALLALAVSLADNAPVSIVEPYLADA